MAEGDPLKIEEEKQLGREMGFKHEELLFGIAFYRNDGGGKFTEMSDKAGLETFWPWGIANGDFDGLSLSDCSDMELARVRHRMGFVFQDFALVPGLRVWENVTYPLVPRGIARATRFQRAKELLSRVGLTGKLRSRPNELSGGEQQRVALARAIVAEPEVILADEPTSNLDDAAGQVVIDVLVHAHRQGNTVVVSSHDPRLTDLATHRFNLEAGRLKT